jgi:hypothetical protein
MKPDQDGNSGRSGFTILDLLVFIVAAVPAGLIAKHFGETRPGLIFGISYLPLGVLFWAMTFVWVPLMIQKIRGTRPPNEKE